MKRRFTILLLAGSLLVPAAAVSGQPERENEAVGAPADLFAVEDDTVSIVVTYNGVGTEVVWVSDPQAIDDTAMYEGELSAVELSAASDMLAFSALANCKLKVKRPRKYGQRMRATSQQKCWGSEVDTHESWLELQKYVEYDETEGWLVQATDNDETDGGRTIYLQAQDSCGSLQTHRWRSLALGLARLTDGDVLDIGPIYSSTTRAQCS